MVLIQAPDPGQIIRTFGGQIQCRIEVDTGLEGEVGGLWDTAEWDIDDWGSADASWFDITNYVLSVSGGGGAERWGSRFSAQAFTIEVDNTSGIFTPNLDVDNPWLVPFRPGRRIRIVAIPDPTAPLTKIPIFTGELDEAPTIFGSAGFDIRAGLHCVDNQEPWQAHNPPALETPTGVQSTDERVEAALDRLGWPAELRDIQTGAHSMASSFLAQSTLEECMRAAEAEGGAFYAGRDGSAIFKARDWLITDPRSINIQGYLGYDEIPTGVQSARILDIKPSWEKARIVNQVEFARTGGTVQLVEDPDSITLFRERSYNRLDFENNSDAQVLALAERYLEAYKDLRGRIDEVKIVGVEDPENEDLNRLIWDTQYGDLLSIRVAPPWDWEFEALTQVMAIEHRITSDDWEVTLKLDDSLTNLIPESS